MKYKIEITETLQKIVEIEAENEQEALDKIETRYYGGDIVLDSENITQSEFKKV